MLQISSSTEPFIDFTAFIINLLFVYPGNPWSIVLPKVMITHNISNQMATLQKNKT